MRFDKITNRTFSCTKQCTKLLLLILSIAAPNGLLKKLFRFSEKEVWLLDVISFIVMSFQIFCGCLIEQMQLNSTMDNIPIAQCFESKYRYIFILETSGKSFQVFFSLESLAQTRQCQPPYSLFSWRIHNKNTKKTLCNFS